MSTLTPPGGPPRPPLTPLSQPLQPSQPGQQIKKPASMPGQGIPGMTKETTPPKCFGTDYFGKWNATGMTFEAMKIDRPDYQMKCANCPLFEKCYLANHIRLLRIKR